jgi:hypothetical protein
MARSSSTASVAALIFVGIILAFLGLFAAGSFELIALGVVALLGAGLFQVLDRRAG